MRNLRKSDNYTIIILSIIPRFINLYNQAIINSPKSDELSERLEGLNAFFTKSIYDNVCRSLFEKDKLIFSLVLTLGILRSKVGFIFLWMPLDENTYTYT